MRRSITAIAVILAVVIITVPAAMMINNSDDKSETDVIETPAKVITEKQTITATPLISNKTETVYPIEPATLASVTVEDKETEEPYIEVAAVPDGTRISLGIFTVTAYCDCSVCCGKWSGHKMSIPTQAGMPYPVEGYTISVDPKVIPLKSVVELEGYGTRYAHDTGSGIKGKRIDMYFASHQDALNFGKQKLEVWVYE